MRKGILCALVAALGLTLCSCTAPDGEEVAPAEASPAETTLAQGSEEQARYVILFSNMRIRDIQELQGFFNAVDHLSRNHDYGERMYLAGYGDALLCDSYGSYNTLVEIVSQEAAQELLGENLCAAFAREIDARRGFLEQVRSNTIAPSLMDPKSEFHALMPKVQDAYNEILPYSVYIVCTSGSEEEKARYCEAVEEFAGLLEEATELLRADGD